MSVNTSEITKSIIKPEPPRDQWGRYLIPTGKKGKPESYTRATTVAKGMADTFGLEKWQQGMVANGMGRKPELVKMARNHPNYEEAKSIYREITDAAFEASDGNDGRRAGTALHKLTERWDLGLITETELERMDPDDLSRLRKYDETLQAKGIEVDTKHVEEVLVLKGLDDDPDAMEADPAAGWRIAGTADRFVTLADGRYVIADLKTGKGVDLGALEFAIQLAIYANHNHTFDAAKGKLGPRIEVDRTVGLIIHLPSQGEVRCDTYLIDLEVGYGALICAMERRDWQRQGRIVLSPYNPHHGGTGGASAQRDWIAERIQRVTEHEDDGATDLLVSLWDAVDVPIPLPPTLTAEQVDTMDNVLFGVEGAFELGLPPARPGAAVAKATRKKQPTKKTNTRSK